MDDAPPQPAKGGQISATTGSPGPASGPEGAQSPHRHRDQNDPPGKDGSSVANGADAQGPTSQDGAHKPNASASMGGAGARPPSTVEEWLKHLFNGSKPAGTAADNTNEHGLKSRQPPMSTFVEPPSALTASAKSRPIKSAGRGVLPGPAEFPQAEVLVSKPTPDVLKRAEQLGFVQNGAVSQTTTGGSMARFLAPPGVGAEHALAMLNDALPGRIMGINETYRLFHPSTEPTDGTPTPMATACGTDRCFGSNLIGWRPQLQACAKKARIGVIDTSFDRSHPAFRKRQIVERPLALSRAHANDRDAPNWHGTGVLSILAGDPQSGTPGLIPDAHYMIADVFHADANGLPVSDTASLIEALDWLEQMHADIINMSLTGPHDELLQAQIEHMSRKGILIVAAVGNDGPTAPPTYPSAYAPVLAVTAINKDLSSYSFANRGDHVDLSAPGVRIWTAMPGGSGTYHTGTSFAVPYATAVAAAIYPGLQVKSKDELLRHMNFVDLGPPGRDPIYGRGLVVAPYACAQEPDGPAVTAPAHPAAEFVTTVSIAGDRRTGLGAATSPSAGR